MQIYYQVVNTKIRSAVGKISIKLLEQFFSVFLFIIKYSKATQLDIV